MPSTPAPRPARTRRVLGAIVAVLLALGAAVGGAAPAYADGDVTGRLVDQLGTPILGLEFDIWSTTSGLVDTVTTDASTGEFSYPLTTGNYYYWAHDGALDAASNTYGLASQSFSIGVGDNALGDIVVPKYVMVSGTITNWTSAMGDLGIQIKSESSGFFTTASGTSTGATFSIPSVLDDGEYTLYFQLDSSSTAPFLDAYLGGEFFDPAAADTVTATAGTPLPGITMAMPDAAFIRGTVRDATTHAGIPDITVSAEDRPNSDFYAETDTDADGEYELRVIPGLTYAVYADDFATGTYRSMTYDGLDGCGCVFTPVEPTDATPATGIDFDLVEDDSAVEIVGSLLDDNADPYDDVAVHLYKPVTGGWREVDVTLSDNAGDFDLLLPAFGSYRLRFADTHTGRWLKVIAGLGGEGSASGPGPISGCAVDTGPLDADSVDFGVAYFVIAQLDPAGGCRAQPKPSGGSGHSSDGGPRTRTYVATTLPPSIPTATPTPAPASDPTPSASPSVQPTASAAPSATPDPVPAGDTGFPWWIILIIVVAPGVVIVIVVLLRR